MLRFEGQVGLVAGGARGIGAGIAFRLAREGCKVVILDVLEYLLEDRLRMGNEHLPVTGDKCDISKEGNVVNAVTDLLGKYHRLDILVNCVGIMGQTGVKTNEYSTDIFKNVIDVNLLGAFLLTKYGVRPMIDQGYGRILHLASIGGKEGNPGMMGYAASKAGLMGLIKGAGKEFAENGITVNGIAPAVIDTELNDTTTPEVLKYMTDKIPMKRMGTIEEVAALACWIVSREASFNTGVIFDLSGGRATY